MTKRRANRQRGSALVETALVTIPFFTLVLGIITAGYLVFIYNSTAFMAQQGSRWASVRGSTSTSPATAASVQTYVDTQAAGLVSGSVAVTTTWSPNNKPGSTVSVKVAYLAQPLSTLGFPSALSISSSSSTTISK
ncbi:MAG: pilus assembly protein [Acidobacteriia bacterium]|nr:pilus assembly protein [Terriglobia bacterium]MBV8905755.1 pilus assembly protein [Terriglobia bacterium]